MKSTQYRPAQLALSLTTLTLTALGLAAPVEAEVIRIDVRGRVTGNLGLPGAGPLSGTRPGSRVHLQLQVDQQGTVVTPGELAHFQVIPGTAQVTVGTTPYGVSPAVPVEMHDDAPTYGDRLRMGLTPVDQANTEIYFGFGSAVMDLWSSTDLLETVGTYTPNSSVYLTCDIAGSGTLLQIEVERVDVELLIHVQEFCTADSGNCPCGNHASGDLSCSNSTGSGAELDAHGLSSLAAGNLELTASGMPASSTAILFRGSQLVGTGAPFLLGDGLRCVDGPLQRYTARVADGAGVARWTSAELLTTDWSVGQRRAFQVWYADAGGSPCSTGFNVTQGLAMVLQP